MSRLENDLPIESYLNNERQAHGIMGDWHLLDTQGHYTGVVTRRKTCWCSPDIIECADGVIVGHRMAS